MATVSAAGSKYILHIKMHMFNVIILNRSLMYKHMPNMLPGTGKCRGMFAMRCILSDN